ncbi:ferredoxin-thioredoxin reductase catalytic domain-containing protein [Mailhella massiliensis]|uniref:ferredoxin-thioredoxin reductase catalytic domain-containing protein n=1 Tax=Mailhella massiliensis TaxID=1903261 RepID=UPI00097DEBDF|nr:ferredoxin-thioredoxin reductase catalytic domain-containing protein [Mailhella massiliensis]
MTPEQLLDCLAKGAAAKGYYLHADHEHCLGTAESLLANKERYGYMCCPCRLACSDRQQDSDIICPCVYRDADIAEYGACFCSFYVSEEHKDDPDFFPEVEERRDPSRGL